jgi:hypothetical protein
MIGEFLDYSEYIRQFYKVPRGRPPLEVISYRRCGAFRANSLSRRTGNAFRANSESGLAKQRNVSAATATWRIRDADVVHLQVRSKNLAAGRRP